MTALNKRLYTIKRLANHIPRNKLKKVADSLWTSKLRYGLQLCVKVRQRGRKHRWKYENGADSTEQNAENTNNTHKGQTKCQLFLSISLSTILSLKMPRYQII